MGGMHTHFRGCAHTERIWQPNEQKRCKVLLVGSNLNIDKLVGSFAKCMASNHSQIQTRLGLLIFRALPLACLIWPWGGLIKKNVLTLVIMKSMKKNAHASAVLFEFFGLVDAL